MKKKQPQRSLLTMIHKGAPKNLGSALIWLVYTFVGVGLSFLVGAGINLLNSGHLNDPSLIRHGELFAISASLLVGAMRLVSKDDGLEAFSGRQIITILVFGVALAAQAGYVLLKLVNDGLLKDKFAYLLEGCSVYSIGIVILLVFFITLLDASRLQADEAIDVIENDYRNLDSRMGGPQ